jgi:hypothetical protein
LTNKRYRKILLVVIVPVGIAACGLAAISLFFNLFLPLEGLFGNGCPSQFPSQIEEAARFRLPPSARNLESLCTGMQGWIAQANFDIDPQDIDVLIDSTSILRPLSSTNVPEALQDDIAAQNIETYLYGQAESGWQKIFIDTTDPNVYRVYLSAQGGN